MRNYTTEVSTKTIGKLLNLFRQFIIVRQFCLQFNIYENS